MPDLWLLSCVELVSSYDYVVRSCVEVLFSLLCRLMFSCWICVILLCCVEAGQRSCHHITGPGRVQEWHPHPALVPLALLHHPLFGFPPNPRKKTSWKESLELDSTSTTFLFPPSVTLNVVDGTMVNTLSHFNTNEGNGKKTKNKKVFLFI